MPLKAPRICVCGKIVPHGILCQCARKRRADTDRKRPSARERGYTTEWQKARAEYLAAHPCCKRCGAKATVVHHVIAHKGDMRLFWRRSNWLATCTPCHDSHFQSAERRSARA